MNNGSIMSLASSLLMASEHNVLSNENKEVPPAQQPLQSVIVQSNFKLELTQERREDLLACIQRIRAQLNDSMPPAIQQHIPNAAGDQV